jgi:hypothetical protein
MPSAKETRAERLARIQRERDEDAADRLPVTVRNADGSLNLRETGRIEANNTFTDINRRLNREFGRLTPNRSDSSGMRSAVNAANAMSDAGMKKGGGVKKMAGGGCTRGDGIASRGKTKGRMI